MRGASDWRTRDRIVVRSDLSCTNISRVAGVTGTAILRSISTVNVRKTQRRACYCCAASARGKIYTTDCLDDAVAGWSRAVASITDTIISRKIRSRAVKWTRNNDTRARMERKRHRFGNNTGIACITNAVVRWQIGSETVSRARHR